MIILWCIFAEYCCEEPDVRLLAHLRFKSVTKVRRAGRPMGARLRHRACLTTIDCPNQVVLAELHCL